MSVYLSLEPRDTVVARDSRPFGGGSGRKMRSLPFLYPQLPAGVLRTLLGKMSGWTFDDPQVRALLAVSCHGPVLEREMGKESELWFPRPLDLVMNEGGERFRLRPGRVSGVAAGPAGLAETPILEGAKEEFKPARVPAFLPGSCVAEWLSGKTPALPKEALDKKPLAAEERVHVSLNAETGAAEDSLLFVSSGLRFGAEFRMSLRVESSEPVLASQLTKLSECHPMGGERRLAFWRTNPRTPKGWQCPDDVRAALANSKGRVRMMLATPGLFSKGYLPGWLAGEDRVPGTNVRLRCVAAAVDRWAAISGWSYERKSFGPKAIRRVAPAGSVYFCDVVEGKAADLAQCWLQPVSDEGQDRRDGYGLALFGIEE